MNHKAYINPENVIHVREIQKFSYFFKCVQPEVNVVFFKVALILYDKIAVFLENV